MIGFLLLLASRRVDHMNAAAIAAHYGSVSAGTFLTAIAYLDNLGIAYDSYPVIMLAVMESPAIIVGLLLASWSRQRLAAGIRTGPGGEAVIDREGNDGQFAHLLHEALTNGSVVLLIGSMVIGAISAPQSMTKLYPFMNDIFMGMLCLFLLEMGMEAARRIGSSQSGTVLVVFGMLMPLIGGAIGVAVGHWMLGLNPGGVALVGVLGASASSTSRCRRRCAWRCPRPISLYLTLIGDHLSLQCGGRYSALLPLGATGRS